MSVEYNVNVYVPATAQTEQTSPGLESMTDATQADDVRTILQRFAVTGIASGRDPSRDSYIGSMSDDNPIDDKKVDDLLETPDLSYMDEMEMQDFIRDNVSVQEPEPEPEPEPDPDSGTPPSDPDATPPPGE